MQVLSNRACLSHCRANPPNASSPSFWFQNLQHKGFRNRSLSSRTSASYQQHDVADLAQRETVAAHATSTLSRRQALSLLLSGALVTATVAGRELATPPTALAALKDYNPLGPNAPIEEVTMQLGTEDGQYAFIPSTLELTAGRLYKLRLRNPSTSTHYFTAFEFAEKSFTVMVLAGDPAVEVKGGIQEVALKAGSSATWVLVPMKPGKYPLRCTVKGHDAMVGEIIVRRAAE